MTHARPTRRRGRSAAAVVAGAACGVLLPVAPAQAHTDLVSADPAPGRTAAGPVSRLRLVFDEPVVPDLTYLVVTGPGAPVRGETAVSGATVDVTLPVLDQPGHYRVGYRTVATDGHPVSGSFSFRVRGSARAGALVAAPSGASPLGPAAGSARDLAGLAAVTTAGVAVTGLALARRRRARPQPVVRPEAW